jgi:hemoglobin
MCDGHRMTNNTESHSCACNGHQGSEVGRTVDAATELILPAVPFPSRRVLEIAGEDTLRQVVRRHHALLQASPIAELFTKDPWAFAKLAEKVADFVVESCGGATTYSEQNGGTCMRTRHFPFSIDERSRETWLAALFQAMVDVGFPAEVSEEYWNWLEAFSVRMVNRRTMKSQPARLPFIMAQLRFGGGSGKGLECGVRMRFCPHHG